MSGRLRRLVGAATLTAFTAGALIGMPVAPATAAPEHPTAGDSRGRDPEAEAEADPAAEEAEATGAGPDTATETATAEDADTGPDTGPDTRMGAGPGPEPGPGAPSVGTRPVAGLLTDLQRLHREAKEAAEAFTATDEELAEQRAEVATLDRRLAVARLSLHDSRGAAGRLARQQYQSSSTALSPYVRLLFARDPRRALEQGHVIGQVARERAETVERMVGTEQDTAALARRARVALDRQLTLAERREREHDDVRDRLDEIEDLLAAITPEQLAAVKESERNTTGEAGHRKAGLLKLPSS